MVQSLSMFSMVALDPSVMSKYLPIYKMPFRTPLERFICLSVITMVELEIGEVFIR
jgi:hypothetical protein